MESIIRGPLAAAAAAVLGAGILTATPAGAPQLPALRSEAIAPASLVGELLDDVSTLTDVLVGAVQIPAYATIDAPFLAGELLVEGIKSPSLIANLASYGLQRYINPKIAFGFTWPDSFDYYVIAPILGLLPPAISGPVATALNSVGTAISTALSGLPDPVPGFNAYNKALNGPGVLPHLLDATSHALEAPVRIIGAEIQWLGALPSLLFRTLSDAFTNPSNIPGLLSNLVFQTVGLDNYSFLDRIVFTVVDVLDRLPGPIGSVCNPGCTSGLAFQGYTALSNGWNNFLGSLLPTPIIPPPAAALPASATSSLAARKPAAVRSVSPAAASGVGVHAVHPAAAANPQPDTVTAAPEQPSADIRGAAPHTVKHPVTRRQAHAGG